MNVSRLSTLTRPPIVEAVVDFDCDMPQGYDLEREQSKLATALKPDYPALEPIHRADLTFQLSPETSKSGIERTLDALRFRNDHGNQIVQYRNGGYSFNRLAPYSSFDDYAMELYKRWLQFIELASPIVLQKIRLRYINSLDLPIIEGRVHYGKYINCAVVLTENGLESREFFASLNVGDETGTMYGTVTSASQTSSDSHASVLIDVVVQVETACDVADLEAIKQMVERLRSFKNRVFASVVTDSYIEYRSSQ